MASNGFWNNTTPGYAKFDNSKSYLMELISREENKFFAVKALFSLAALQIICGTFILFAQIKLNNIVDCNSSCVISNAGIVCGCLIALNGMVTALTTHYKTDSLLVVSGLLNVILYGVSIFSFAMSVFITASPSVIETHRIVYGVMAIIAAVNLVVSILTSAFFCRAGCSCCQPHAPAIMYLTQTDSTQIEINDGNFATEA